MIIKKCNAEQTIFLTLLNMRMDDGRLFNFVVNTIRRRFDRYISNIFSTGMNMYSWNLCFGNF